LIQNRIGGGFRTELVVSGLENERGQPFKPR